jgi:hypothetical protein
MVTLMVFIWLTISRLFDSSSKIVPERALAPEPPPVTATFSG